ncbi:hypothetical protein GOV05_04105 [Candidatus Woesearchaeota archaeon]|nr:hypothetical protein [Candidatus Woesearchaeota archaeon]
MFNKRGQAAMEFLMTYGWAILVVLAAIGALAYFGVLSPEKLVPERTTFQAPFASSEKAVVRQSGNVSVALTNNFGSTVTIETLTGYNGTGDCVAAGIEASATSVSNGEVVILSWDCGTLVQGERFNADVSFSYSGTSGLTHIHTGTISALVSS